MLLLERLRNKLRRPKLPALHTLGQPYSELLQSLYRGERQAGLDGQLHDIEVVTGIPQEEGMWIYDLCRKTQPNATLEVGMGYGFSTLYFLAAGPPSHTAIDPFELTRWHGIALREASEAGAQVELINESSVKAGVNLAESGRHFDVIFIDGNHRFDDVLVDFTLFAKVCSISGYIILDDTWMPSIKTALSFVEKNRPDFERLHTPVSRAAVFRKVGEDKRNWDHFHPFAVAR